MPDVFLFRYALRDLLRPKRLLAALLFAALPAAIALLWRFKGTPESWAGATAYNTLSAGLVFGFILVLLTAVFSTGAVSREMEQKTISYLLTRPLPRWRILTAKFLPAVLVTLCIACLAAGALAVACWGWDGLRNPVFLRDVKILPIGCLAYGAGFLVLATVIQRPLLWGLLFTFGWESWVPNLPGSFRKASLMSYLRVLSPHPAPEGELTDMSELLSMLAPTTITNLLAWQVLITVTAVSFLAALLVFSWREYAPRDDTD